MNQLLRPGQVVHTKSGTGECSVEQFLGGGGQGEVYRVRMGEDCFALKWYNSASATSQQREALLRLIQKGSPSDRFLWPLELMHSAAAGSFGYLMPLRPEGYHRVDAMMTRRIEPGFRAVTTACFELAGSFLQLHAQGLCYRDISFGNIFLEPNNGTILICDNDNVEEDGKAIPGIAGTPRFMAPEVVRGEALPSSKSDLFSLAVLLFYMLMMHHPLEGEREQAIRCLDAPAMAQLYGKNPIFIFDPTDERNRPMPGTQDNALVFWRLYPEFIRKLFIRAFTAGIRDPDNGRVRESEWRAAMVQLRDSISYCACGSELFIEGATTGIRCWACGRQAPTPLVLKVGRAQVALNHDTLLFPHHTSRDQTYDFTVPTARVTRHPTRTDRWGLQNLTNGNWVATLKDGGQLTIEPQRGVVLRVGTRIQFGQVTAEICG